MVRINERLSIPGAELSFTASRSGGPGGQHVNKVNSRVTLRFDLAGSPSLTDAQKRRIGSRLATRVSKGGELRIVCQSHRSQAANRKEAVERFAKLLGRALKRATPRRKTKVPGVDRRRRMEEKRHRGKLKRQRSRPEERDG